MIDIYPFILYDVLYRFKKSILLINTVFLLL